MREDQFSADNKSRETESSQKEHDSVSLASTGNQEPILPGTAQVSDYIEPSEVLPVEQRNQRIGQLTLKSESYSGLLPHPDHFERFTAHIPNGADRFMQQIEKEQSHRHDMEKQEAARRFELSKLEIECQAQSEASIIRNAREEQRGDRTLRICITIGAHILAFFAVYEGASVIRAGHDWAGGSIIGIVGTIFTTAWASSILRKDKHKVDDSDNDAE